MITLKLQLMDRDHLRKVMHLISNYNKLNDDEIEVISAYEIVIDNGDTNENLQTDVQQ